MICQSRMAIRDSATGQEKNQAKVAKARHDWSAYATVRFANYVNIIISLITHGDTQGAGARWREMVDTYKRKLSAFRKRCE